MLAPGGFDKYNIPLSEIRSREMGVIRSFAIADKNKFT
jgi:hypothetical protein